MKMQTSNKELERKIRVLEEQKLELERKLYHYGSKEDPDKITDQDDPETAQQQNTEEDNLMNYVAELKAVFEAIDDAILIYDTNMKVRSVNPVFFKSFGFNPVGYHVKDIIKRVSCRWLDGRPFVFEDQPTPRALLGEKTESALFSITLSDGREAIIETSSGPMKRGDEIIGTVTVWHDITRRVHVEEALKQSEMRYRKLIELSPNAIFLFRGNSIALVNPAALELMKGDYPEQILGKKIEDITHPDYHHLIQDRVYKMNLGHEVPVIEEKFISLKGDVLDVEVTSSPVYDPSGLSVQVIARDITDRKKREAELNKLNLSLIALSKSSQAMARAKTEQSYLEEICKIVVEDCGHAMVWIGFAEEGGMKKVKPAAFAGLDKGYLDMLNISWGDTEYGRGPTGIAVRTGKPAMCRNILTDPDFGPWRQEALKRGYASSIALPLTVDNKTFGALTIYSPMPDPFSEDEIDLLCELAKDLAYGISSIRWRTAQAKAEKALQESEEKFRMLTEKSNALIFETDIQGNIIYANSGFYENLGYNTDVSLSLFGICHSGMVAEIRQKIALVSQNQDPENGEWLFADHKGNWHWFNCYLNTYINSRGEKLIGLVAFDVTEKKNAEERLEKYASDLKETNATKDKFFRIIAHDLKNPFCSLLGASELLATSSESYDKNTIKDISKVLHDAAKRGYSLLENLLEWSRSQTGNLTFNPQSLNIRELVSENMSNLDVMAMNKNIFMTSEIADDIQVVADRNMLNTVLRNIINNAIKFTHEGGNIVINAETTPNNVLIAVKDSGIGIPKEDISKLFKIDVKYIRLGTLNETGTGLGLILCKEFIEKHKGKIWVESETGKGCEFKFFIPRS